jgi:hypothetical protein
MTPKRAGILVSMAVVAAAGLGAGVAIAATSGGALPLQAPLPALRTGRVTPTTTR